MSYHKIRDTPKGVLIRLKKYPDEEEPNYFYLGYTKTTEGSAVAFIKPAKLKFNEKNSKFYMDFGDILVWLEAYELKRLAKRFLEIAKAMSEVRAE